MIVAIPKETYPGERRVAMIPAAAPKLTKAGLTVRIESGAGVAAGFPDDEYQAAGVEIVADRSALFAAADVVLQVRTLGANPQAGQADVPLLRKGQILVGLGEPMTAGTANQALAESGVTLFCLELLPRITRAQVMDVLSSQATIAGYKAVLLAAEALPRMFPMMITAAGTLTAAHVLVIGAGVAGLQAISTARRLGAIVEAYDIRPSAREQVQSVGAKFVELPLATAGTETTGGYAKAQSEEFLRQQRELMGQVVARNDVVICTAAVPGRRAPILVTAEMVRKMRPSSVIVDLVADRGGNCELTRPDETVVENGVTILGTTNLASLVPAHASQMYARNISAFLLGLLDKQGQLKIDTEDEIIRATMVCRDGAVVLQTAQPTAPAQPPVPAPA